MGLKPTQYRCAAESLLRRLRTQGSLPRLHPLVDLCNAVSLAFAVPVAVLDADRIAWPLEVRYATGDEDYLTFGGETEHPAPGEVIFADQDSEDGISHHVMGVPSIMVEDDTAAAETYALVHRAKGDPSDGGEILVRAIRYLDKLRRTPDGWRIFDRLHVADMGMSVPALFTTTFNERRTADRADFPR